MEYLLRLVIASIMGFIIGLTSNREDNTQSSRAFSLICMGAALTTIISLEIYRNMSIPAVGDPGRIPSQVISALGFLGTGMIWVTEDEKVRGITDAASVWLTAILGMLIGAGMNDISIIGTTFFVLIYWITPFISVRMRK